MKYICYFFLFLFFFACDDPDSVEIKFGKVHEAEYISKDPFSMGSDIWAEHIKNYFSHKILVNHWGFEDVYIAIYRDDNWLSICHVINKPFGKEGKFLYFKITDKEGEFIIDNDLLRKELERDPGLGIKSVFFRNNILLNIQRIPINNIYISKQVHVIAETIPINIEIGKKQTLILIQIKRHN